MCDPFGLWQTMHSRGPGRSSPFIASAAGLGRDRGRHVDAAGPVAELTLDTVLDGEGRIALPRLGIGGGGMAAEADRAFEGVLVDP